MEKTTGHGLSDEYTNDQTPSSLKVINFYE